MRARFPRPWISPASERLTREVVDALAGRLDAIAYPGLTANFDAGGFTEVRFTATL
ncbi:hypothetical protein HNP84_004246 [Thermocatellispora tengchongensis]|uniref:Uncharacterized protein n=1 Tax=Thermocatellispora tengchongensis TaxID=1073253 RepID=A0A840NZZ3_9ACTN|nr:hypothetical protein [Thermocatellispora tengchongensis]MBB5134514.1 hypothetical protein [Thermocatellispora tengchongensis]